MFENVMRYKLKATAATSPTKTAPTSAMISTTSEMDTSRRETTAAPYHVARAVKRGREVFQLTETADYLRGLILKIKIRKLISRHSFL